jgi:predicted metalloprotease with PDZ domain
MWRGGLSGPGSLFVHASRPLLTPDGTSPLLHELFHTILPRPGAPGDDWIVEGLAEVYALEMLVRSGTISRARHERILAGLAERGGEAASLRVPASEGAVTARAVTLLYELDERIRKESQGASSLDEVVRALAASPDPLSTPRLREAAEQAARADLASWFDRPELAAPGP